MDMSVQILSYPDKHSPAFNSISFLLSSDQTHQEGFRYTVDIWSGSTYLLPLRIEKMPDTGYGYVDLAPIVSAYIDHEKGLPWGTGGFRPANGWGLSFSAAFGESFNHYVFTDNAFSDGRVMFVGDGAHDFEEGDMVYVAQDPGYTNAQYNGVHTVYSVTQNTVTIDLTFGASTGPEGGKIRHANGEGVVLTGLTSVSGNTYAIGLSWPQELMGTYDDRDYMHGHGAQAKDWITNAPDGFRMARSTGQSFLPLRNNSNITRLFFTTYADEAGTVPIGTYRVNNAYSATTGQEFLWLGIGPQNLAASAVAISGPSDPFAGQEKSYRLRIEDASLTNTMSSERLIVLDDRCSHFDRHDLLFLDKRGAWGMFSFNMRSDRTHRISKGTYSRGAQPQVVGTNVRYESEKMGSKTFTLDHQIEWTLRSQEMNDVESVYFMELLSSPSVFLMETTRRPIPVLVSNGDYDELRFNNEVDPIVWEINVTKALRQNVPI